MNAVSERYRALLDAGELREDQDQRAAISALDRLAGEFERVGTPGLWQRLTG